MIKAIFFDIDGTLVSLNTHQLPATTISVLEKAQARGIKIFIATGRPYVIINNLNRIRHLIDGFITCNGAYCFVGKQTVSLNPIPPEQLKIIIRIADKMHLAYTLSSTQGMAVGNFTKKTSEFFFELLHLDGEKMTQSLEQVLKQPALEITVFMTLEEEKYILSQVPDCNTCRWHPVFADITARGSDKGNALASIAAFEHIDLSETVAFGDGGNDIPMIRRAGTGIAMGNAEQEVKDSADYVTTSVDNDGIMSAFKHLGIISN